MQALMDGVVLAIDREDRHALSDSRLHDETASHHEHLFVRERNGFPGLDGREYRVERSGSRRGTQDKIHVWMCGHRDEPLCTHARDINTPAIRSAQRHPRLGECARRGHGDRARPELFNLSDEAVGVLTSSQADDLQPARMCLHDRQRAAADRAGGPEDGDAFQGASLCSQSRIPTESRIPTYGP